MAATQSTLPPEPSRAATLIAQLGLQAHPEGGHFSEVYRASAQVVAGDGRGSRAALTAIYFLLAEGEKSCWHRVLSDEVWHFYEGDPLELWIAPPEFNRVECLQVGPLTEQACPQQIVPAGWWQAARPLGQYTLVGCTVGPGFDFADFALLRDTDWRNLVPNGLRGEAEQFL